MLRAYFSGVGAGFFAAAPWREIHDVAVEQLREEILLRQSGLSGVDRSLCAPS
jgi:hypothetical protein